ncbi:MAG: Asp23/Gls24 family envelope stress response protein [Anaerolineales bacterium]|nr:MAG: Asp23/Gls24 family envelope stress response protein [Anaerolineales bacterium]
MGQALGTVTIHPTVLITVARLTSLATPGIARMSDEWRLNVERMLGRPGRGSGVDLVIKDSQVSLDLYVVAEREANLLQLGQTLQKEVSRAIEDMVGMEVLAVNVHIQDVDFPLVRSY